MLVVVVELGDEVEVVDVDLGYFEVVGKVL